MKRNLCTAAVLVTGAWNGAAAVAETVVDFGGVAPGTVLTNQFAGLTFSATNDHLDVQDPSVLVWDFNGNPGSAATGQQGPPWTGGNIPASEDLANGIVVSGRSSFPFEGRRPAGDIFIEFAEQINRFGFTVVDVEGIEEFTTDSGFFLDFVSDGRTVGSIDFVDLITPGNPFYDSTIDFGNGSANRVQPIAASTFSVTGFDRVEISLGGSAAVASVRYETVPTPTAALGGLALLGLATVRRWWSNSA